MFFNSMNLGTKMVVAILGQDSPFFVVVFSLVSHPWLGPHPVSFQEALSGVFEHNDRSYRFQIPDAMYLYKPLLSFWSSTMQHTFLYYSSHSTVTRAVSAIFMQQ